MIADGCPDANTLAAFDDLPPDERGRIADHAASCASCHAVFADLYSSPTQARSSDAPEPVTIDRYRVERRLGAGAMGIVYKAHDPELDRPVAVKLLRAGASADRLRREAQSLAKLTHANVVAVHDVGTHEDSTFVAMALVDGENLRGWLRTPRTTEQIVDVIVQAGRGIAAAHAAGIVHRDLKPDNIFVGQRGEVLVGDFGLARSSAFPRTQDKPPPDIEVSGTLTATGIVLGTPAYMPPEQAHGDASPASDQFSLCVTAWEALYGARPFAGKTLDELIAAIRRGPPAEPKSRRVPSSIVGALRRGLAADPQARHASIDALIDALARRRRRWPALAGAGAIAAAIVIGVVVREPAAPRAELASCRAADPLAAIWQPPRRQALAGGLAPALASLVLGKLDGYTAAGSRLRRDTCGALDAGALPITKAGAILGCLERRAATLDAVLPALAGGSALEVLAYVEGLEPVEQCPSAELSIASRRVSGPALASLERELDLLELRARAADRTLAVTELGGLAQRADAIGDPTASASAHALAGTAAFARGRTAEAEVFLRRAADLADTGKSDRVRTRAAATLVELLVTTGRLGEAALQHEVAVAALARAGSDPIGEVLVEHTGATLARARHQDAAELAALDKIVELARRRHGAASLTAATARAELAAALARTGDAARAEAIRDEARRGLAGVVPADALEAWHRGRH